MHARCPFRLTPLHSYKYLKGRFDKRRNLTEKLNLFFFSVKKIMDCFEWWAAA